MLYAYCVTRTGTESPRNLTGLFDQEVYAIEAGEVSAFVSNVAEKQVAVSKHSVLTHQKVVGSLLDATTPLPFRFGTVVNEPDLLSYLGSRQKSLLEKLAAVDSCVEMSIKVIWQKSPQDAPAKTDSIEAVKASSAGTEFLRKKSAELVGSQQSINEANELAAWLKSCLGSYVREVQTTIRPAERLVLAADCLVARIQLDQYESAVEVARAERPELHFLSSGPWAPYSFANLELEFKSQFGVS